MVISQPIPAEICLTCDVCCRFPEVDSFLSPYFSEEEIAQAISPWGKGIQFRPIPPSAGGQVIPVPWNDQFRCPFFSLEAHICGIYDRRPLDCRLYPYALMLDPNASGVWLGIDTKCPATKDTGIFEKLVTSGGAIWKGAMSPKLIRHLEKNPRLIGPYQPDVLPLFRLDELTAALLSSDRLIPLKVTGEAFPRLQDHKTTDSTGGPVGTTRPFGLSDRAIFEVYLRKTKPCLASHAFAMHLLTVDLMPLEWSEVEGFMCLWVSDSGTVYMPLPPLGQGDFQQVLHRCFDFMDQRNGDPEVSRVENLNLLNLSEVSVEEFQIRPGFPEYVYRRKDLVELRGRAFHGKRSDCRVFGKTRGIEYRPYSPRDRTAALALFYRWQTDRMRKTDDPVHKKMLQDAKFYHHRALTEGEVLGLIGRVIWRKEQMIAYTFGVPLNEDTFVVALEATDPSCRGASAYIFREFARELSDYAYINAMDDSGIPGLRRLKMSYHPNRLEPSFTLRRREEGPGNFCS